jgi:hypothetical protein
MGWSCPSSAVASALSPIGPAVDREVHHEQSRRRRVCAHVLPLEQPPDRLARALSLLGRVDCCRHWGSLHTLPV